MTLNGKSRMKLIHRPELLDMFLLMLMFADAVHGTICHFNGMTHLISSRFHYRLNLPWLVEGTSRGNAEVRHTSALPGVPLHRQGSKPAGRATADSADLLPTMATLAGVQRGLDQMAS